MLSSNFQLKGRTIHIWIIKYTLLMFFFSTLPLSSQEAVRHSSPIPIAGETTSTDVIEWLPEQNIIITSEQFRLVAHQFDGLEIASVSLPNNSIITDIESVATGLLVVSDAEGNINFVDTENWQIIERFNISDEAIKEITISEGGTYLGIITNNRLKVYTIDYEHIDLTFNFERRINYLSEFILFNSQLGFSGGLDGIIRVWDIVGKEEYTTLSIDQEAPITDLDISHDLRLLASAYSIGVSLWDIRTREKVLDLPSNEVSPKWAIAFNPSDTQLAVGSALGSVDIWSLAPLEMILSWHSIDSGITDIAYSANGQFLAARYENDLVQIWDISNVYCKTDKSE